MFGDSGSKAVSTPQFPLFLLPSLKIPFRRRQPSTSAVSTASTTSRHSSVVSASSPPSLSSSPGSSINDSTLGSSPISSTSPASFTFSSVATFTPSSFERDRLARTAPDTLRCNTCSTDVAFGAQIVSKGFTGRHGRAYLVSAPLATATPSCPSSPTAAASPLASKEKERERERDSGNLINVRVGRPENRQLVTGAHVVADIHCVVCGAKLGWKYVDAREQAQKYKVGKFILETQRVVAHRSWEDVPAAAGDGDELTSAHFYDAETGGSAAQRRRAAGERRVSAGSIEEVLEEDEDADEPVVFDSEDEDECEDIFAGTWDAEVVAKRRSRKVGSRKKVAV